MSLKSPYESALSLIDSAHSLDPNKLRGTEIPYELHYAQKSTFYLNTLCPHPSSDQSEPSAPLRLAIHAQHFRRWEVPRSSYPDGRAGYLRWRSFLKTRQAEQVKAICLEVGMGENEAERVAALIRKEDLKKDAETQTLEDVACLVFLDDQFEEFERGHDEEKIVGILRKTWGKMSERGRGEALKIKMSERAKELVRKALQGEDGEGLE